jgi:hypothetical protein
MNSFAKSIVSSALIAMAISISAMSAAHAQAEPQGSTCSDCASFVGAYSIENKTGLTITYQYRWGDNAPWKTVVAEDHTRHTIKYPLGTNSATAVPRPSVRFDSRRCQGHTCVGATIWKQYVMNFHALELNPGYVTSGTRYKKGKPERYKFTVSGGDFGIIRFDVVKK